MTTVPDNKWQLQADKIQFETRAFIDGDYRQSGGHDSFQTVNPATGETLVSIPDGGAGIVDRAVSAARAAFKPWRTMSPNKRKAILLSLADQIAAESETLALLDSLEMGMPILTAFQKANVAADTFRYYAESIDKVYGEVAPSHTLSTLAISVLEPRGVVGVITPWNSPLVVAVSAIAPSLAAGNTVVLKPSEQTPSSLLKFAEIAARAGLPAGVLNIVLGLGTTTGKALASHSDIDLLHFTGSTPVGRQLMQYAGQSNGKPLVLEMGGKSPQIIFEDAAELPNLGACLAQAAFVNTGQLCVARTRLLVHENCKASVLSALNEQVANIYNIGNPLDEATTFGPISSQKQFDRVNHYLAVGSREGATPISLTTAGEMPSTGFFMQPTVFDNVDNRMTIAQEEIFGPVLSVISFKNDDEAIQLANDVSYSLAASAWTKDLGRARRLTRDLAAGSVNIYTTTEATPSSSGLTGEPFGASGFGVESGMRGLTPYTRTKAVQIVTP